MSPGTSGARVSLSYTHKGWTSQDIHKLTPVSHGLKAALGAKDKVHSNYPRSPQANTSRGCQLVRVNDSGGSVSLRKGAHSICHAGNLSPQTWLGPATLLQFNTEAKMQKEVRDNVRPRNIDSLIKCLMAAYCKTEELVVGQMWASLFHPTPSAQPNLSKPHLFTGPCVLTGSGVDFLSEQSAFLLVSAQHSAVSAPVTLWILL